MHTQEVDDSALLGAGARAKVYLSIQDRRRSARCKLPPQASKMKWGRRVPVAYFSP